MKECTGHFYRPRSRKGNVFTFSAFLSTCGGGRIVLPSCPSHWTRPWTTWIALQTMNHLTKLLPQNHVHEPPDPNPQTMRLLTCTRPGPWGTWPAPPPTMSHMTYPSAPDHEPSDLCPQTTSHLTHIPPFHPARAALQSTQVLSIISCFWLSSHVWTSQQ